jgi:hypothetical protein
MRPMPADAPVTSQRWRSKVQLAFCQSSERQS